MTTHQRRAQSGAVPRTGIGERAAELVRLRDELQRAYAAREGSDEAGQTWRLAAQRFQDATKAFYEPFTGLGGRIRTGDRDAIDTASDFLRPTPGVSVLGT